LLPCLCIKAEQKIIAACAFTKRKNLYFDNQKLAKNLEKCLTGSSPGTFWPRIWVPQRCFLGFSGKF
jgi:hypothetical protein